LLNDVIMCVNRVFFWVLTLLATSLSTPAFAQYTGHARVSLVDRLSLTKTADLDFGTLIPDADGGTATVSATGVRSVASGTVAAGGTVSAAEFAGYGQRNQRVRIIVPASSSVTRTGGTQTMAVTNFTIDAVPANGLQQNGQGQNPPRFRITSNSGLFTFTVGARLTLGGNQMPGTYVGTFPVTIVYE
jgi:hypothetical protein